MIARVFLGWQEPVLPLAARYLADRHTGDGVLDMRGSCVVVPGARAGRRLRELLLDIATVRGATLIPPRVVSTRDAPELFYTPRGRPADDLLGRQAWASALRESPPESVARLFGEAPDAADIVAWNRLGSRVAKLHREVAGGGFDFGAVAALCARSADLLHDDSDRWALLDGVEAIFRDRLAACGVTDRDLERIAALERGDLRTDVRVWLVGVVDLPPVTARMIERAAGSITALVHAPEAEAAAFDGIGLVAADAWRERDLNVPDDVVRLADGPADQAAATLDALARLGDAPTGEVVVSVTDAALVPYLRQWIELTGLAVHYGGGKKISESRPCRLLAAVSDHLGGGEWEALASLLRHPDFERWAADQAGPSLDAGRPVELDRLFARHLPGRPGGPRRAPGGGGTRIDALVEAIEHSAPMQELVDPRSRPLGEWAAPILAFLAEVYAATPLDRRDPEARQVAAVLETIRKAALGLYRLPPALSPRCDVAAAIRILIEEIGAGPVAEEPEGTPVEVIGWLEAAVDDAPHLVVVGVNEGLLPESTNADTFLPDQLRGRLGIHDNAARYARDAFHLTANLASRRSVSLIPGRLDISGDPLRPSRLLLSERGERLARRVQAFMSGEVRRPAREAPILAVAGAVSAFQQPPEPVLRFDPPASLRVTDFRSIISDPYRFVLSRILRLESIDDAARELDSLAFGTLAHAVLQRFGSSTDRDSTDVRQITARLMSDLDDEVRRRYPDSFPAVHFQVEHLRSRLRRFAEWQAERAADGWRIVVVEGAPATSNVEEDGRRADAGSSHCLFEVDDEPIQLTGRIDRIDHHPDTGRWALLDYKTGDSVTPPEKAHRRKGAWIDLQLPLYRHLAASFRSADGSPLIPEDAPLEFGYIALPRVLDEVGGSTVDWGADDLADADETARALVRRLRTGVVGFERVRAAYGYRDPFAPLLGDRLLVAAGDPDGGEEGGER